LTGIVGLFHSIPVSLLYPFHDYYSHASL
jgi:hypothetical protein